VAATCSPELPDTTGWRRHELADVSILLPGDYRAINRTSRSVQFRKPTATLTLSVTTSAVPPIYWETRPDRTNFERACEGVSGGYRGRFYASFYDRIYRVQAAWEGRNFWPETDWRRQLLADFATTRLTEATALRMALHTIRAVRDSLRQP
jgi:hypothetical protein